MGSNLELQSFVRHDAATMCNLHAGSRLAGGWPRNTAECMELKFW